MSVCPRCATDARHVGVWVSWVLRTVFVEHNCDTCGNQWMEPAMDESAVLAKVGLKRTGAV